MTACPPVQDDGGAAHLDKGLMLPDIALPASDGGTINLARQGGRSVVYCYSWTGRPGAANPPDWDHIPGAHGSTPQTEGYRDLHGAFSALDVTVFGLSTQDTDWQRELVARLGVPFLLLSDELHLFSSVLKLPYFETGGERYLKRLTLVACDGLIERVFYPVHDPAADASHILGWIRFIHKA